MKKVLGSFYGYGKKRRGIFQDGNDALGTIVAQQGLLISRSPPFKNPGNNELCVFAKIQCSKFRVPKRSFGQLWWNRYCLLVYHLATERYKDSSKRAYHLALPKHCRTPERPAYLLVRMVIH